MKYIIIALVGAFSLFSTTTTEAQKAERDQYTIQVDGLGCPFCAFGLEKKFKEFKGIKGVKIDMETGVFNFTYPSDKPLSIEEVQVQVDKAGYTPMTTKIVRADGTVEEQKMELPVFEINEDAVVTEILKVSGKCEMCEKRIERASVYLIGVISAEWKKKAQTLEVKYDKSKVSLEDVASAIADAGYDNEKFKANDDDYDALPACCHYKRAK